MKLHTQSRQREQFLLDISVLLHGIRMGVCLNENGTSKCTSGANYICISVLRVTDQRELLSYETSMQRELRPVQGCALRRNHRVPKGPQP